ncbi:carbohydrate ABC transporter substrate-binding protein, CUT1 family [Natronorubrum texcoconense]|uniref:Carbohydrate ABC transporter substrate-binding protein, CUT1 family n=2 Tax=Natronorubrum texcoconense TaxID=1095776 RepID=A0A1G8UFQ7_9EURY|nr:carbohydrate ABC transporter substrate-binding protein, CUT1 family [Natronorubrum texcoconense]
MTMNRRSILKGIGGTAAATTLAGCIGGLFTGDDPEVLWHEFQDAEAEDFNDFLAEFNEETGHDLGSNSVNEMEEQLETALPAGEGPVGFTWAHDWIGLYHDEGYLYDATDDIDLNLEDTYSEAAAEAVQWEGNVYGLPYAAETVTLMYNREMVEEPPETIDEMEEIMEDYHDPDGEGTYGLAYPPTDVYFMSAYLQAFDGLLFDEEADELGVDSDAVIEGGEFIEQSLYPYTPAASDNEAHEATFGDGNAPFTINGPWMTGEYADLDLGVAPLPLPDGGEPTPLTGIPLWYFTTEGEEADEGTLESVVEFAEWYTTNDDVITTNADNGMIPVHNDHVGSDELGETVGAFSETVDMGVPMPADAKMDSVWAPMEDALDQLFSGSESAADAFETAADEIRDSWD